MPQSHLPFSNTLAAEPRMNSCSNPGRETHGGLDEGSSSMDEEREMA